MGLRSPFGYVGYEVAMAEMFIAILDKLCAHCHTNADYPRKCRECLAGNLAFACKSYILTTEPSSKQYEFYLSEEWARGREKNGMPPYSEHELETFRQMMANYKPEGDILLSMIKRIKKLTPHPLFYVRHHHKYPYERPKALVDFAELTAQYKTLREERSRKWGEA